MASGVLVRGNTARARDAESSEKGYRVWKPVEFQAWIGHGWHRRPRPRQICQPRGAEASWAHS
eukprot:8422189-Pyramimonas_sp.AAC.1